MNPLIKSSSLSENEPTLMRIEKMYKMDETEKCRKRRRLSKGMIPNFNCCFLTSQPCRNPVITPEGYVYEKDAIIGYICKQRSKIDHRIKSYRRLIQKKSRPIKLDTEFGLFKRPKLDVLCPMSGNSLKEQDLVPFGFTEKIGKDTINSRDLTNQYACAVSGATLGNELPCAVLRTSKTVVTLECAENLIKGDRIDPVNGKELTKKDVIPFRWFFV